MKKLLTIISIAGIFYILSFDDNNVPVISFQKLLLTTVTTLKTIPTTIHSSVNPLTTNDVTITNSVSTQDDNLTKLADLIFYNEGAGIKSNLVHWNEGESFASMGIGHFLWYPANSNKLYKEQFPLLIEYMQSVNVDIPVSIKNAINKGGAPWSSLSEFTAKKDSAETKEMIEFLYNTRHYQAKFIQQRFYVELLGVELSSKERKIVKSRVQDILNKPGGWYLLIDYANFKGFGGVGNSAYNNADWGLVAVLLNMKDGPDVFANFSESAYKVLVTRVNNAPASKIEQERKWLVGWKKRTDSYMSVNSKT